MKSSYVIVIFGASGSGKTSLMRLIQQLGGQYSVHFKTSDRPERKHGDLELISDHNFNPLDFDYVYETYGHRYGIQRSQIDKAIQNNKHHFIICNDITTIKAIKRDYGARVKVIFFYFDAPAKVMLKIQKARGIHDNEIQKRLAKTVELNRHFLEYYELFDGTLLNHFGEDTDALKDRMKTLLKQLKNQDKILRSNLRSLATHLSKSITP
ncbi:MAG: hypothetical protein U9N57_02760 [Pseudomonadota bacterium]|nr:hypothetical protein [Pseudomonadota bacterium]